MQFTIWYADSDPDAPQDEYQFMPVSVESGSEFLYPVGTFYEIEALLPVYSVRHHDGGGAPHGDYVWMAPVPDGAEFKLPFGGVVRSQPVAEWIRVWKN